MDYQAIAASLQSALQLGQPPVAVCLTDDVPEGVRMYEGPVPAGCVFWQEAARGAFATAAADHEQCAVGVYTHNLAQPSGAYPGELAAVLKVMAGMEYVREEDVERIPVMKRQARHVVYAPLAETPLAPDAVLLFADARQALVLTEAIQQVEPAVPPALGRPACAVVPQAINTGRAALSLGCCGARAYVDVFRDDVGLWALPGPTIDQYAARVAVLAKANDTLGRFHRQRRADVEGGARPTYAESLARLNS
jgi:uncharacterized protein (DUF169 family)